ncbi:hypothetical protein SB783_38505 [Paraburkholderia sp. SIMBA_009]
MSRNRPGWGIRAITNTFNLQMKKNKLTASPDSKQQEITKVMTVSDLKTLIKSNAIMISHLGARIAVFQRFAEAVRSHTDTSTKYEILVALRSGVESTMALVDDIAMEVEVDSTYEYHKAMLGQLNELMSMLK